MPTLAEVKEGIRNRITSLEERWKDCPESANIIIVTYVTTHQADAIRDLNAKLHPNDVLVVGCNINLFHSVQNIVGVQNILLLSEEIPYGFLESIGMKFFTMSMEEMGKQRDEYWAELRKTHFTMFQRDNGFLQVGDTVKSLEGNRWNQFNTFSADPSHLIDGGNFIHNNRGQLVTMSTRDTKQANDLEHLLRERKLFPVYDFKSMISLPNLKHILQLPHADMCVVWLNENTIGIAQFADQQHKTLNKDLVKLLQNFARDCFEAHGRSINVVKIPCFSTGAHGDGRGLYAQAVVTPHAIYIPQFPTRQTPNTSEEDMAMYRKADEDARSAYEVAERLHGNGRPIIQVDSALLSSGSLGGLHCLTTQLNGRAALKLLKDLKEKGAKEEAWDGHCFLA